MNLPVDKSAAQLAKLFEDLEKYIMSLVTEAMTKDPQQRSLLYWKRRAQLVHAELERLSKLLLKKTPDVVAEAYQHGLVIATQDMQYVNGAFGTAYNQRAMALIAAGLNTKLDAALATVGRRVNDAFRRAGLRASAYHAMAGTNQKVATQQLVNMLKKEGKQSFVDKAGRQWSLGVYSRMVIRTTTREAVSQGTAYGLEDNGHELVKFSSHAQSCDMCLEYDGRTFALPGHTVEGYRTLHPDELPPIHPNCRHSIGPALVRFEEMERQLLAWKKEMQPA